MTQRCYEEPFVVLHNVVYRYESGVVTHNVMTGLDGICDMGKMSIKMGRTRVAARGQQRTASYFFRVSRVIGDRRVSS